jgi:GH15 family glucan-1,4-alpha-glucosidase
MEYKPIEDYGVIGNLETAALVGRDGAIDWCCFPHVESSSLFARILDSDRGGHFTVQPSASFETLQEYVDRTNVLQTRFRTASGQATITDFMPVPEVAQGNRTPNATIYRHLTGDSGQVDLQIEFEPRFEYARTVPTIKPTRHGIAAQGADETAFLSSSISLQTLDHGATAVSTLTEGESHWLILGYDHELPIEPANHRHVREEVVRYWRNWAHECSDTDACPIGGPWHQIAVRSALALKLLIHHDTGAICAAPTTSLPEDIGSVRNWDYRYNWIRDAAFTVRALAELGHVAEANAYFSLCLDHCSRGDPADITPVYGLHGDQVPDERTLDHLSGYRNSAPVRIGNAAGDQYQLDVYGELIHGIHETTRYGETIDEQDWRVIKGMINYVCEAWQEPDAGIWEVRADRLHFVYSKIMCWVAVDRGLKIVEETELDGPVDRWKESRQAIKETVIERGYSETANSFVRAFGDEDTLDATSLLIPVVGFLPSEDPRVQATIDAILERLTTADGLVDRYEGDDGLPGEEGAFVLCSFWLVTALALSGRTEEATTVFQNVLQYVSPLGLLAEEIDPETGTQLGNYPQAFSHIGLINSALALGEAQKGTNPIPDVAGTDATDENDTSTDHST